MRIGVMLGGARAAPPLSELTRRTRDLEARGFDTLWLPGVFGLQVLEQERDAAKGSVGQVALGLLARALKACVHDRVQARVEGLDARDRLLDELARGDLPAGHELREAQAVEGLALREARAYVPAAAAGRIAFVDRPLQSYRQHESAVTGYQRDDADSWLPSSPRLVRALREPDLLTPRARWQLDRIAREAPARRATFAAGAAEGLGPRLAAAGPRLAVGPEQWQGFF